jgi:surfactin synthase thioesterase subunit
VLESDAAVNIANGGATLDLGPVAASRDTALIFICGRGVAAEAYVPLLRPVAEAGYAVFIVKLSYRFAPLESHKQAAVDQALDVIATHPRIRQWVVAGHSLGGALACRVVQSDRKSISGLFGHYGHQLFDGTPSISREAQQTKTRAALLRMLDNVAK